MGYCVDGLCDKQHLLLRMLYPMEHLTLGCSPSRDRYAARSRGFTAVPVIQGRAAVVTMATFLPGSRKLLVWPPFLLRLRLGACCCSKHGVGQRWHFAVMVDTQNALRRTGALQPRASHCILIQRTT